MNTEKTEKDGFSQIFSTLTSSLKAVIGHFSLLFNQINGRK
jgi:hypothetical protein